MENRYQGGGIGTREIGWDQGGEMETGIERRNWDHGGGIGTTGEIRTRENENGPRKERMWTREKA